MAASKKSKSSRNYRDKCLKLLWGRSAARCAFEGTCRRPLTEPAKPKDPAATSGEIAHIVASSAAGPRGDPEFPEADRDRYKNLILLCGPHHKIVDQQANTYTIADLTGWKTAHEEWVQEQLVVAVPTVSFTELEFVAQALLASGQSLPPTTNFDLTAPKAKMSKNGLTGQVLFQITMGLSKAAEVSNYISETSKINPEFPEKLRTGFVEEYNALVESGVAGDALFNSLLEFASLGSSEFGRRAAGLAVLCYFFETCEVFEK